VPGGASTSFTYTYTAVGTAAAITFSSVAQGVDHNSGLAASSVTGTSNVVQVVDNFPNLAGSWLAANPLTATAGQQVTAYFVVTNNNLLVPASNVVVQSFGVSTTAGNTYLGGPNPPVVTSLGGGASTTFTFRYSFATALSETASFTAVAVASTGPASSVTRGATVLVQAAPVLSVTGISLSPTTVSSGQIVTLQVTV